MSTRCCAGGLALLALLGRPALVVAETDETAARIAGALGYDVAA